MLIVAASAGKVVLIVVVCLVVAVGAIWRLNHIQKRGRDDCSPR
jgi:hypothetical protein